MYLVSVGGVNALIKTVCLSKYYVGDTYKAAVSYRIFMTRCLSVA